MQLFLHFSIEDCVQKKITIIIFSFETFLSQFKKYMYFTKQHDWLEPGKLK